MSKQRKRRLQTSTRLMWRIWWLKLRLWIRNQWLIHSAATSIQICSRWRPRNSTIRDCHSWTHLTHSRLSRHFQRCTALEKWIRQRHWITKSSTTIATRCQLAPASILSIPRKLKTASFFDRRAQVSEDEVLEYILTLLNRVRSYSLKMNRAVALMRRKIVASNSWCQSATGEGQPIPTMARSTPFKANYMQLRRAKYSGHPVESQVTAELMIWMSELANPSSKRVIWQS